MAKITLEDINTWLLKYGELDAPKYTMPHIEIINPLYRGNINNVNDIIQLPEGVDYTVYYENRPVETISLTEDYGEGCNLRVVTKSSYPYVNSDVRITVPVETKHLTSLEDLNTYDFGYVDSLSNVSGVVSNSVHILLSDDAVFSGCDLTFDADVVMSGNLVVTDTFIRNNVSLALDSVVFSGSVEGLDYLIVNEGSLRIVDCTVECGSPFILNKGSLSLVNNTILCNCLSVPFIYSNNSDLVVQANSVVYSSVLDYNDFGVCFIRSTLDNVDKIIQGNDFSYVNVQVNIDGTDYLLNGTGLCYAKLDDDTVYVKDLEVV